MARLTGSTSNDAPAPSTASIKLVANDNDTSESLETGEQTTIHETCATAKIMPTRSKGLQNTSADIEEVRRNLLRQNRNLARSHSAQSLQIRTLGAEVSRLLAANLVLKEEVIHLRDEAKKARSQACVSGFDELRNVLRRKIDDIAVLLNAPSIEINGGQSPQMSPEARKSMCLEGMEFRERASLRDLMFDARMPNITEEEVLQLTENVDMSNSSNENGAASPDLEPPTLSLPQEEHVAAEDMVETEECKPQEETSALFNVEARRRRREPLQSRRRSSLISPLADGELSSENLRAGAKRKISEVGDREPIKIVSRRKQDENSVPTMKNTQLKAEEKRSPAAKTRPVLGEKSRTALVDKSVNISPRKPVRSEKDTKPAAKSTTKKRKTIDRSDAVKLFHVSVDHDAEPILPTTEILSQAAVDEMDIPPKTPGDLLSPISSDGWARNDGKADTPPPVALSMTTIPDERPSRRARAAVNYAEPSLVAKMRRPSKQMVDALSGLQDPRSVMSTSGRRSSKIVEDSSRLVDVEPSVEEQASGGEPELELPSNVTASRGTDDEEIDRRTSSITLSTLMAKQKDNKERQESKMEDLAIFDIQDRSPHLSRSEDDDSDFQPAKNALKSRRHSSAKSATRKSRGSSVNMTGGNDVMKRASKISDRRKSMMI